MSQLRNLLTNKVVTFRIGTKALSSLRKSRKTSAARTAKLRNEIAERRLLAASQNQGKPQPKPGLLRRIVNAFRRTAKVA